MAHNVEPMDLDSIDSEFDNKENSFHHNNVLQCTEKGYEELDVSEINMKLRYSITNTPAASPMSKSYTQCIDNHNFDSDDSLNCTVNEVNLTQSYNSTLTKHENINKIKTLPLQPLYKDQVFDGNRNTAVVRSSDTTLVNDNTTIVISGNDEDNLSIPSSSSSNVQTPEVTTPVKDITKGDTSPIMRGLKSVLNMFRPSTSPIPPAESDNQTLGASPANSTLISGNNEKIAVSTPVSAYKSKESGSKRNSPLKESIVFNDEIEKELQWKDETTIFFNHEKIPIHKLFLLQDKQSPEKPKEDIEIKNNSIVEYMDVSYNDSQIDKTMTNVPDIKNDPTESDSEFVDCETTFTRTESPVKNIVDQQDIANTVKIVSNNTMEHLVKQASKVILNITVPVSDDIVGINTVSDRSKINDLSEDEKPEVCNILLNETVSADNILDQLTNGTTSKSANDTSEETNLISEKNVTDTMQTQNDRIVETEVSLDSIDFNVTPKANIVTSEPLVLRQCPSMEQSKERMEIKMLGNLVTQTPPLSNTDSLVTNYELDSLEPNLKCDISSVNSDIEITIDGTTIMFPSDKVMPDSISSTILNTELSVIDKKEAPADIPLPDDEDFDKSLNIISNNVNIQSLTCNTDEVDHSALPSVESDTNALIKNEDVSFNINSLEIDGTLNNITTLDLNQTDLSQILNDIDNIIKSDTNAIITGRETEDQLSMKNQNISMDTCESVVKFETLPDILSHTNTLNADTFKNNEFLDNTQSITSHTDKTQLEDAGDNFDILKNRQSVEKQINVLVDQVAIKTDVMKSSEELFSAVTESTSVNMNMNNSIKSEDLDLTEDATRFDVRSNYISEVQRHVAEIAGNTSSIMPQHELEYEINNSSNEKFNDQTLEEKKLLTVIKDITDKINEDQVKVDITFNNTNETTKQSETLKNIDVANHNNSQQHNKTYETKLSTEMVDIANETVPNCESSKENIDITTVHNLQLVLVDSENQNNTYEIEKSPDTVENSNEDKTESYKDKDRQCCYPLKNETFVSIAEQTPQEENVANNINTQTYNYSEIDSTALKSHQQGEKEVDESMPDKEDSKNENVKTSNNDVIANNILLNKETTPQKYEFNIEQKEILKQCLENNDEEIIISENNSPYVSVAANLDIVSKEIPLETENLINHHKTKSNSNSSPNSPPIVSKGYTFNFDEIDDPFATKMKIRESPTAESPNKISELPHKLQDKKTIVKTDINKKRRMSHTERKKTVNRNTFNTTFNSTTEFKKQSQTVLSTTVTTDTPIDNITLNVSNSKNDINMSEKLCSVNETLDIKCLDALNYGEHLDNRAVAASESIHVEQTSENLVDFKVLSEENATYNSSRTDNVNFKSRNVFNIPEIDDINFNPFATKTKVCQSPPPHTDVDNPFITKNKMASSPNTSMIDMNINTTNNVVETKSPVDKTDTELMEKDSLSNTSCNTCSSKATDDINTTVREVHTEDEDTEEGPFLEAEDNDDKVSTFGGENGDMMQFPDLTSQGQGNAETGEVFIDAEAFEFLLNQNTHNVVADSGKESLFLKFDPLFAKRISSGGVFTALSKIQNRQSTPSKLAKTNKDNTPMQPSPLQITKAANSTYDFNIKEMPEMSNEDQNMTISKPMMVVTPAVNPIPLPRKSITPTRTNRRSLTFTSPAMAVIDRLLSMSANNSLLGDETVTQVSQEQHEADFALSQLRELLAEKEIHVYNLRLESKELRDRLSTMETQIKSLETEGKERLGKINELNEKLAEKTKINKSMAAVVEEYERTIASLIAETEQDKKRHAEERIKLMNERDEQTAHLSSMEVSFSDLHMKYEKSKQVIMTYKANEEAYKKSLTEFEENLTKMQNNYELLKQHATSKLNHANQELEKMNRAHEAEVLKLNAMIKRKELHITSLEETLIQKTKANEELTAICDELINKVG